ncbi:MAG: response regulator [bacterium]|nr:response regulator [bacterium]
MEQAEKRKVLIAEDEGSIRELLQELICEEGYSVDTAANGLEARQLLEKDSYSLLITDLKMPFINGLDLIAQAREIDEGMPIIAITGYPREELMTKALENGANDCLIKPFKIDDLIDLVRRYIR